MGGLNITQFLRIRDDNLVFDELIENTKLLVLRMKVLFCKNTSSPWQHPSNIDFPNVD